MKLVMASSDAALTVSKELQKMLLQYRIAFLLSLPKKERLLFLLGLNQLLLSCMAQIASEVPRTDPPAVSLIVETVCRPIVRTGPPSIAFIN